MECEQLEAGKNDRTIWGRQREDRRMKKRKNSSSDTEKLQKFLQGSRLKKKSDGRHGKGEGFKDNEVQDKGKV